MKETRHGKISICKPGGTAGNGSKTYRLIIPNNWMNELNITPEDREVLLEFDGKQITIKKVEKL